MCGIAGYIGSKRIPDENALQCLGSMADRGPDDRGVYRHKYGNRHVLLIHTRLAIIDLDKRSSQPFKHDGSALCFNGEIYNYIEIRKMLEEKGARFSTSSDTEVLHISLNEYGESILDKLEGMWAFAFYRETDGKLILCRDRFGEKPLYVHKASDGIFFASTPKALFELLGHNLPVNIDHLKRFLVNGYKSIYKHSDTFFLGLKEVPSRNIWEIDRDNHVSEKCYWEIDSDSEDDSISFANSASLVRDNLLKSIELRLRSDVPLAFCMSGGIDSNALISTAKRIFDYDVHGFTIVNSDMRYNEQEMVDIAVRELGIRHTKVLLDKVDFLSNLRKLIKIHDAPVYTISYYVHWLLMEQIHRSGYKISISGTAADELFSGYYDHHLFYLASIKNDKTHYQLSKDNWITHVKPIVRNPLLQYPDIFVENQNFRDHVYFRANEFSSRLHVPFLEIFNEKEYPGKLLRKRMLNELFEEVIPVILHEDDVNAMSFSIENRSPFLDRNLFETSLKIPTRHLIVNGFAKAVLRQSMRGIVPDTILDCRTKVGFNAPVMDLLDIKDERVRRELLIDSPVFDLVKRDVIENLIKTSELKNSESKFLFSFLGIKMFLEEYGN